MVVIDIITEWFLKSPLLFLFAILGLGQALGRVRFGSFKLGVAAMLFVALALSALHPDLMLPEIIYQIGLVFFVYTIGLASSRLFVNSFRRNGLRDNILCAAVIIVAALLTVGFARILPLSKSLAAGLFTGSLTNTPALAAVVEALQAQPGITTAALAEPVISYSLAYPVSVIGVILTIHLFSRLWRVDFAQEARHYRDIGDAVEAAQRPNEPPKEQAELDLVAAGLGICLGLLAGMIKIPLPGGVTFQLGFAGGPLLVALVLGYMGRSGPLVWQMPATVNNTLRQLGIALFLAGIGTRAGYAFANTFSQLGATMVLAAAAISIVYATLTLILGYKLFRIPMSVLSGLLAGLQTQPATLAFSTEKADSELPYVGYATVYPMAMVMKILIAQVLLGVLN